MQAMRTMWAALAALGVASSGCTAARMAVPAELGARAEAMPVVRRTGLFQDGSLRFDGHRVTDYHRGWTTNPSVRFGPVSAEVELHPYHFRVAAEGEAARGVECAVKTERVSLHEEGTVAGRPVSSETSVEVYPRTLSCAITGERGGSLTVERRAGPGLLGQMAGSVRVEDVSLDITSSTQLEGGGQLAYAGYHLRFGQALVAAVETVNDGRVWLVPDLAPEVREAAVVAAAALLLDRDWPTDAE